MTGERETVNRKRQPGARTEPPLRLFAVAPPGFRDVVAAELEGLGFRGVAEEEGGVRFVGGWLEVYRANLELRVASRVLVRVARFRTGGFRGLERELGTVDWPRWLPSGAELDIRAVSHRSRMYHTGKISEVTLDVLDRAVAARPGAGGYRIQLRVVGDRVVVSLDTSGEHLHHRGYRTDSGPAPLRENLAAGLLARAGRRDDEPVLDPMCGSGTLVIEAALAARKIAPGLSRGFAFETLPGFDPTGWRALQSEARDRVLPTLPSPVFASDQDPVALQRVAGAARRAGLADDLQIARADFAELDPPTPSGLVLTNPPYGRRLGRSETAYRILDERLGGPFRAWRWAVVAPRNRLPGLPDAARWPFLNGGLPMHLWMGPRGREEDPFALHRRTHG